MGKTRVRIVEGYGYDVLEHQINSAIETLENTPGINIVVDTVEIIQHTYINGAVLLTGVIMYTVWEQED